MEPYQKSKEQYLIKEHYQEYKKSTLSRKLIMDLKKVPYQGSKKSTLSRNLIRSFKKVPYQGSKKCLIKLV